MPPAPVTTDTMASIMRSLTTSSAAELAAPSLLSGAVPGYAAAPFLPMSRKEMEALGWDQCDVILVTGDAYIDHPSFGMALVGRFARGVRIPCGHHQPA